MKEYKLVAIDLDDTLLADDLTISPQTIKAIQDSIKKGVTVTFATGRMFQSAAQFAKEIQLNVPIITYQGAYVRNILDGNVIYERFLAKEVSLDIIGRLKEKNKTIQIYLNDELYVEKENQYIKKYSTLTKVNYHVVDDLGEFIENSDTTPMKILAIDEPEKIKEMLVEFKNIYQNGIHVTISKPNFLEFSHREATKGQAIQFLANKIGISLNEVIGIGDSLNDYDLIEVAGLGVAMENAHPDIKEIADFVTKSNNDHGVYEVLQKFVLST